MPAREPHRDVGVDAVVEAEPVDQPVGGGEIDPGLAGFIRDGRGRDVRSRGSGSPFSRTGVLHCNKRGDKTKLSTIDA